MTSLYPADTVSGVVTSFIPLTTVFTPPSSCSSIYRQDGASYMAFDPGYGLDVDGNVICQPPAVTTWWEQADLGDAATGHTAVSLGPLTCPDNWKTMESSVKDDSSTAVICCPSGYYLDGGQVGQITGACLSDVSSGYQGTWAHTDDGTSWATTTSTLTVSSSTVGAIAVLGWNIRESATTASSIRISTISSDSSPSTLATSTMATDLSIASSATSTSISSSTSSPSPSGGLATGASIGVGVGVALGVIGIISLVGTVCLARRKRQKTAIVETEQAPPLPEMTDFKPPEGRGFWSAQELGVDSQRQRSELHAEDAFKPPVELAG